SAASPPTPDNAQSGAPARSISLAATEGTWLASWVVAGVYGLLVLAHVGAYGFGVGSGTDRTGRVASSLGRLTSPTRPERGGEWRRQHFAEQSRNPGSAYGEFSRVWTYRRGHLEATISLDSPFTEWHELTVCYVNQGWGTGAETVERVDLGHP